MKKYLPAGFLSFLLIVSFSSCGNFFQPGKTKRKVKTISILQYQGNDLIGTTVCSFDSTGKKRTEHFCASDGKFPSTINYFYDEDGLLTESRENDTTMRTRIFFKYQDTLKISEEDFSEFCEGDDCDTTPDFFKMTEEELSDKVSSLNTTYSYDEEKLAASETEGMEDSETVALRTDYFYFEDGKKRAEITKVSNGSHKGKMTQETDYEYSPDGKTITETHRYFGKNEDKYSIIYRYDNEGVLLTKEFKSKTEIFQRHVCKYDYYN